MGQPLRKPPVTPVNRERKVVPVAQWSPEVRRSYPRYSIDSDVILQPEGSDAVVHARAINLSRGGALIRTADRLDLTRRYLIVFPRDEHDFLVGGHECPACGHHFGAQRLRRSSVWARILRQGRGGSGWAAAVEFEALIDLSEESG